MTFHDVTDTDSWAQNGSTHSRVFATLKRQFVTKMLFIISLRHLSVGPSIYFFGFCFPSVIIMVIHAFVMHRSPL